MFIVMTKEQEAVLQDLLAKRANLSEEDKATLTDLLEATRKMAETTNTELSKGLATKEELEAIRADIHKIEDLLGEEGGKREPQQTEFEKSCRAMFDAIKKGDRKGQEFAEVSVRAASVMDYATQYTNAPDGTAIAIDRRVHAAPEGDDAVVARLNRGASSAKVARYLELDTEEGGAAITAEGQLKPLYSVTYKDGEATGKKIAVRIKVTEEFEEFTDFLNDVLMRARRNLVRAISNEVVNGEGGASHLTGITTAAPGYTLTALNGEVAAPNIIDAILAIATQIRSLHFSPNVAFVNPLDYSKIQFEKDSTGRPLGAESIARLGDIALVKSDSIAQGHVLVMDDRYWKLFVSDIIVKEGYGVQKVGAEYYSDLELNMRTLIFEAKNVLSFIPSTEAGSVCYEAVATVLSAIKKP